MKSLIIFAGAGSSYGISKEKYPMTLDFKKRLPEEIQNSSLFTYLINYLTNSVSDVNIDIEHILWELGNLKNTLDELTLNDKFASHLLSTNQINQFQPYNSHLGQTTHAQLVNLKSINQELINKINERVYDYYAQLPTDDELEVSWLPLLKNVNEYFESIDIVTTNYDLIIESALERLETANINTGFINGVTPRINLDNWNSPESSRRGMLTKLHGSVDWKLGNEGSSTSPVIRRGLLEFEGDHDKRLILYPGFKGTPNREPFVTFHNYFKKRLTEASHLLFIGFAFRDDFINSLISENVNSSCKIAVVDPIEKLQNLSFLNNATHMKQAFGLNMKTSIISRGGMTPFSIQDLSKWLNQLG